MHRFARTLALVSPFVLPVISAAGAAQAADLQRSVEVAAPADQVWAKIGDFCSIESWHPQVESCELEQDDVTVYRTFTTRDGTTFRQQLLEQNPAAFFYSYAMVESPLEVASHTAQFSIGPGPGENSVVVWQSEFSALGVDEDEAEGALGEFYDTGLDGIATMFDGS